LYTLTDAVRKMRRARMVWAGRVGNAEDMKILHKILVGKPEVKIALWRQA
jgi:hypothetical protein